MIWAGSRACFAVVLLSGLVEFAPVAHAATFNFDQLLFTAPAPVAGNSTDVIVPFQKAGEYGFGAEFKQVQDTLSLTNVSIICNGAQGTFCGSFDISFEADNTSSFAGFLSVFLSLDGVLDSAIGFGRVCIAQETSICPADLLGTNSVQLDFGTVGPSTSNSASFALDGGPFSVLGVFHLTSLPADLTGLQLSNSFDINMAAAVGLVQAPEPASAFLMGLGIASLALLRKVKI